jgi:hypothetical protein
MSHTVGLPEEHFHPTGRCKCRRTTIGQVVSAAELLAGVQQPHCISKITETTDLLRYPVGAAVSPPSLMRKRSASGVSKRS